MKISKVFQKCAIKYFNSSSQKTNFKQENLI